MSDSTAEVDEAGTSAESTDPHVLDPLIMDVATAARALHLCDWPYTRRTYIRTVFAAIEGFTAFLKDKALRSIDIGRLKASPEEELALREESFSVASSGEVKKQQRYLPLDVYIRLLFTTYFDRPRAVRKVNYSDPAWGALKRALKVRHRITHPRKGSDLTIEDDELRDCRRAYAWVQITVLEAFADLLEQHANSAPDEIETG
jgi:hypothetical protein